MRTDAEIEKCFEDRAMKGDAGFAIALALLQLTAAQKQIAKTIDKCGMNIYQPDGAPGALEMIGMALIDISEHLDRLVSAEH